MPAAWQDTTLLSVLRDHLGMTGTKYGCGAGHCGACTVLIDGHASRACLLPVEGMRGAEVHTIEGLANADELHPLQQAWIDHAVPQCGYCQPGQLMTAAALLADNPEPSAAQVRDTLHGNLCRCGTYPRIVNAVLDAAAAMRRTAF